MAGNYRTEYIYIQREIQRERERERERPVTIIPIVISAFGTVTKGLLKGLENLEVGRRVETIQITTLLRPSANADVKSSNEWIIIPNHNRIRTLGENETYKYLGNLEADTIKQVQMKDTIRKEYLRRTRKLLETKLSNRNLIKGINTWAVPLVRYSGPFLK